MNPPITQIKIFKDISYMISVRAGFCDARGLCGLCGLDAGARIGCRRGRRHAFDHVFVCARAFTLLCIGFVTTNKPPGRKHTMILGTLNMHLCLFVFLLYTYSI
jgi:hypothetical protein